MENKMQKKIEIILTPKDNGGHDMEFILNKDEFNDGVLKVTTLLAAAAHNFGHKNLNTMQFVAFLESEKDMCEKRKGMALLNELLNIFEKEKTNE